MGGFNYENNKNNPRIYKNSEELTLCSVFVKEFKIALLPILRFLKDGKLHARLVGLFMGIKALDRNSEVGARNVGEGLKTIKGKLLLREFVFTPKAGIRQQFGNPQLDEDDFSVVWKDFNPSSTRFPKGSTHFELNYLVLGYDALQHFFTTYTSEPIRRSKKDKTENLELRVETSIVKEDGIQYILVLGLRFMEILGEEEYESLGRDAVGVEVFGVF